MITQFIKQYIKDNLHETPDGNFVMPMPSLRFYPDGAVPYMFGTVSMHSESEVSLALIQLQHMMHTEISHRQLLSMRKEVRQDFPPGHPTRTGVERLTKKSQRDRREAATV